MSPNKKQGMIVKKFSPVIFFLLGSPLIQFITLYTNTIIIADRIVSMLKIFITLLGSGLRNEIMWDGISKAHFLG